MDYFPSALLSPPSPPLVVHEPLGPGPGIGGVAVALTLQEVIVCPSYSCQVVKYQVHEVLINEIDLEESKGCINQDILREVSWYNIIPMIRKGTDIVMLRKMRWKSKLS